MTDLDSKLVDDIFSAALDLDGAERARYVDRRCAGNEVLKIRIIQLLGAAEAEENLFDSQLSGVRERMLERVLAGDDEDPRDAEDLSGRREGAWRLENRIGRGGLATVYLARRDDGEYDQRAAFKVLRRGLDTDDVVARFRAERQILSTLEHPGIARILDGGALDDGRPYLVLEYVDGTTITEYCRENELGIRDRVKLFVEVIRALHHAHRHLVVHRDIKPSNILVSKECRVSLLDFGIAKLLDPGAVPGASTMTRTGVSLLTPGYCSPEQNAGEPVTTASDIYQAGAVLFELLTGNRPRLASTEVANIEPSKSLPKSGRSAEIGGDLDAIVVKAMHVDPSQRYASASELEADLQRFLDGRPVIARPDTLRYRLVSFSKRRPWVIPGIALGAVVAIGYVVTLVNYNTQLRIEQQRATAAQAFLVDVLASPDPFSPADPELGRNITVVEALNLGVARLESDDDADPQLRASLLTAIANVYAGLDQHDDAIRLGTQALALQRRIFGDRSEEVLRSVALLAQQHHDASRYEEAKDYAEQQLSMTLALYPPDDPRIGVAEIENARIAFAFSRNDEAIELNRRGLEKTRRAPLEYSRAHINGLVALAYLISGDGVDEPMQLLAEAEQVATADGNDDNLSMALIHAQAATTLSANRDYGAAAKRFRAALEIYDKQIGRDHSATLSTLNNLAILQMSTRNYEEAETILEEVLERYLAKYGEDHSVIPTTYQNLATAISRQERYEDSVPLHRKASELYERVAAPGSYEPALPLLTLAWAELQLGRFADARESASRATGLLEETIPGSYPYGVAQCLEGIAMRELGEIEIAERQLAAARPLILGSDSSSVYYQACIGHE